MPSFYVKNVRAVTFFEKSENPIGGVLSTGMFTVCVDELSKTDHKLYVTSSN